MAERLRGDQKPSRLKCPACSTRPVETWATWCNCFGFNTGKDGSPLPDKRLILALLLGLAVALAALTFTICSEDPDAPWLLKAGRQGADCGVWVGGESSPLGLSLHSLNRVNKEVKEPTRHRAAPERTEQARCAAAGYPLHLVMLGVLALPVGPGLGVG